MLGELVGVIERAGIGFEQPGRIGRVTAGDDQRRTALRALGVEGGGARAAVGNGLEARVHRAHDDAVLERDRAGLQRPKQMWIYVHEWQFLGSGRGIMRERRRADNHLVTGRVKTGLPVASGMALAENHTLNF